VALRRAIEVPLETMRRSVDVLRVARAAAEMGNANAVSDAGVSGYLAHAAAQGASLNVEINVMGLRDLEEGDRYRRECADLLREARAIVDDVDRQVRTRIAG
jgi:glutamate formiminotransferase/formiminotetrahydrofolate cyclodeaminase